MVITSHHSYIGRPSPKNFHFHFLRLHYSSKGKRPRTLTRDFSQADPIASLAALREFVGKIGAVREVSFSSSFDDMIAGPCGYAVLSDVEGRMQIVREPANYRVPKGGRLYSLVGGFKASGPEIKVTDHGLASIKEGRAWGGDKRAGVAIASLENIRMLDSREVAIFGLSIGWVLNTVSPSSKAGCQRLLKHLSVYAHGKIETWTRMRAQVGALAK